MSSLDLGLLHPPPPFTIASMVGYMFCCYLPLLSNSYWCSYFLSKILPVYMIPIFLITFIMLDSCHQFYKIAPRTNPNASRSEITWNKANSNFVWHPSLILHYTNGMFIQAATNRVKNGVNGSFIFKRWGGKITKWEKTRAKSQLWFKIGVGTQYSLH